MFLRMSFLQSAQKRLYWIIKSYCRLFFSYYSMGHFNQLPRRACFSERVLFRFCSSSSGVARPTSVINSRPQHFARYLYLPLDFMCIGQSERCPKTADCSKPARAQRGHLFSHLVCCTESKVEQAIDCRSRVTYNVCSVCVCWSVWSLNGLFGKEGRRVYRIRCANAALQETLGVN